MALGFAPKPVGKSSLVLYLLIKNGIERVQPFETESKIINIARQYGLVSNDQRLDGTIPGIDMYNLLFLELPKLGFLRKVSDSQQAYYDVTEKGKEHYESMVKQMEAQYFSVKIQEEFHEENSSNTSIEMAK